MKINNIVKTPAFVILTICFIGIFASAICTNYNKYIDERHVQNTVAMTSIKYEIIAEIDNYIYNVAPNSSVSGEILFNLCEQYGVDVRFAMAQAQVESHYATKGTAKKTNSIFNVGAYDGHSARKQIKNGFGYDNPNDSIEPYLILITSNYLVNGRTIYDLMNKYTNYCGKRYASNPRYEKMLRNVYNRINNITDLDMLIIEYNEYKEIIG